MHNDINFYRILDGIVEKAESSNKKRKSILETAIQKQIQSKEELADISKLKKEKPKVIHLRGKQVFKNQFYKV